MRHLLLTLALCACAAQPANEPENVSIPSGSPLVNGAVADEMAQIENECLGENARAQGNDVSCDWGTLEEARRWRSSRRGVRP